MPGDNTEIFKKNWWIYQQVTEHNYMFHHDFEKEVSSILKRDFQTEQPISVLDSGCGDSWLLSRLLKGRNVASFTGYDMSEMALSFAEKNLAGLSSSLHLQAGPMEESIKKAAPESFDLIYSSFAIHHLQDADKKELLSDFYSRLKQGGTIILIDILRDSSLSRHEYIEEYIRYIDQTWNVFSADDKQLIFDHMRNYDFPVVANEFISWMEEAGFTITERFDADSRNTLVSALKN